MSGQTEERGGRSLFGDGTPGVVSHVRELAGTPARVSVLVGGRRVATLLVQQAAMLGITPGRAWSAELAAEAERLEGLNRAKHDAMKRLARRARGRRELIEWLVAKGHAEAIASEAVARLEELGLVSDERLMTEIVEREGERGASDVAIEETLSARGIDSAASEAHDGKAIRERTRAQHGSERDRATQLVERELDKLVTNRAAKHPRGHSTPPPLQSPPRQSPPLQSPTRQSPPLHPSALKGRSSSGFFGGGAGDSEACAADQGRQEGRRIATRLLGLLARRGHEPELAREVVLKAMRARGWELEEEMD
jgi:SOS response regulatory protein OraA/RecX